MFGRKCSSPGYGFVSGIFFFAALSANLHWENTWPWEILRIWASFPGIRLGNQDRWGGEKESTFDAGRRVETGTYHWEGRKPFIQAFEGLVRELLFQSFVRTRHAKQQIQGLILTHILYREASRRKKRKASWDEDDLGGEDDWGGADSWVCPRSSVVFLFCLSQLMLVAHYASFLNIPGNQTSVLNPLTGSRGSC